MAPESSKIKLDKLDKDILNELQKDATVSYKDLSKKIGAAESTVYDRTRRLRQLGIIKGIVPLLDAKKCGKLTTAWIRVSIDSIKDIGRISNELAMIDELLEVHEISGEWDILVKTKVTDNEELRNLEVEKIGPIKGIKGLYSLIAVRTEKEDIRIKLESLEEQMALNSNE